MNNSNIPQEWDIETTRRYTRQNMDRAMQGRIERGLVELVTNSDDSYRNIEETGKKFRGEIHIEIERHKKSQPTLVIVRDFAEGMTRDDMYRKLGRLGGRTSGQEQGKPRRGLNGRGAKDVCAFGAVTFESIKDGYYNCLVIPKTLKCKFKNPQPLPASEEIRARLGILKGNGTVVTIEVEPRFSIPSHDKLKQDFSRYYSLRDIFSNPNRNVLLIDKRQNRKNPLFYKYPDGEIVYKEEIKITGYPNATAYITIKQHSTPFEQTTLPYREGILIKSRAAIHDCTYFGLESEPLAWRFSGEVVCPYIDELIKEYDDREERDPSAAHSKENPIRLLDPFRDGFIGEHPFAQALYKQCAEILKDLIAKLKLSEPPDQNNVVSEGLRRKLDNAARKVSTLYEQKLQELEEEVTPSTDKLKLGVNIIPPGEHSVVAGESKTFTVIVKYTDTIDEKLPVEVTSSDQRSVNIRSTKVYLTKHPKDPNIGKTTFTVEGLTPDTEAYLAVRYDGYSDVVLVKVVETPPPLEIPEGLSFEKARYRLRVNKEKNLTLWLKTSQHLQEPIEVHIESSSSSIVLKKHGKCLLYPTKEQGIFKGTCIVRGTQLKARGVLTARVAGFDPASTDVYVEEKERKGGIKIEIEPTDEDCGPVRYKWDSNNPNKLLIGARHPTIQRYLGESTGGDYEGIDSVHYHIVLAEVIAEALTFKLLPKIFKKQGENEKLDFTSVDYHFHKHFSDFLAVAHKCLVPNPSLKDETGTEG